MVCFNGLRDLSPIFNYSIPNHTITVGLKDYQEEHNKMSNIVIIYKD